jgi:SAF domain-containing protein
MPVLRSLSPARSWRSVRRAVLARRRPLAAGFAALAVLVAVRAQAAPPPPTVQVLTAAHDLVPGAVVGHDDLTRVPFTPESVPAGVLRSASAVVGRTTTGPVRAGEPITDVRMLSDDLLLGYPGRVAAPLRLGDAGTTRLLRVGDKVTVFAADPQGEVEPVEAARAVPVVALPRAPEGGVAAGSGDLVVVAVDVLTARRLAGLGVSSFLSAVIVR